MMRKTIFLLMFLILIVSSLAAPPQTNTDAGLQLTFPDFSIGPSNTAFEIPVHVYNLEDGLAQNSSVNCTFHIYNSTGHHVLEGYDNFPSHNYDYELEVNDSTFTKEGYYSLQVYCQCEQCSATNTDLGGHVRHTFYISNTGVGETEPFLLLAALFGFAIIISVSLFFMYYFSDEHFLLKLFLTFIVLILMVSVTNFTMQFYNDHQDVSTGVINTLETVYWISLMVLYLFVAYIVIYYGIIAFKYLIEWIRPK